MHTKRKFNNIVKLAAALIVMTIALPSCVYEDFGNENDVVDYPVLPKGKYKIVLNISDADGYKTRGELGDPHPDPGFVDGDHNEHIIGSGNSFIVFLNAAGKIVEVHEIAGDHNEHPENWIEGNYVCTYDVEEDYQTPASCIVLLNATVYADDIKSSVGKDKSFLLDKTQYGYDHPMDVGRDGPNFVMTNSVYIKDREVVMEQPLPLEMVQDADDPLDPAKVAHITVERTVAKASLKYNDSPERYLKTEDWFIPEVDNANLFIKFDEETGLPRYRVVHFRVHPTGWCFNALERESYLFKHLKKEDDNSVSYSDPGRYRSYWAVDPHYEQTEYEERRYPWQYRDAINSTKLDYYKEWVTLDPSNDIDITSDNNILKNFSYNEIQGMNNLEKEIYVPENTFDYGQLKTALDNRPEELAGTHFILTAVLKTALEEGKPNDFQANDIWRDRIGNLYDSEEQAFKALIVTFNYALHSQAEMKYLWYDWNSHGDGDDSWVAGSGQAYSLYYDDKGEYIEATPENIQRIAECYERDNKAPTVDDPNFTEILHDGDIKSGDGQKMIVYDNFKILSNDGKYTPIKIYDLDHWEAVQNHNRNLGGDHGACPFDAEHAKEEVTPTPSRNANLNDYKSILFNWIGPIDHYKDGMMYYYKPVMIDTNTFGVVRNNWYQFVLQGISHLGTSVDKPNEPIVPNNVETHEQAIDIKAKIIQWHEVSFDVPVLR